MSEQHPLIAQVLRYFGLAPPEPTPCTGCGHPPFARTLPHGDGECGCRRCGVYVQAGGGRDDAVRAWNEGAE